MPKRSKIRSIEKMPSSLLCRRPRRKQRLSLKLPGRRLRRRLSSLDSGTQSWLKELNKRKKTKRLLNWRSNRKLLKKKRIERQLRQRRRLKLKLRESTSKN